MYVCMYVSIYLYRCFIISFFSVCVSQAPMDDASLRFMCEPVRREKACKQPAVPGEFFQKQIRVMGSSGGVVGFVTLFRGCSQKESETA